MDYPAIKYSRNDVNAMHADNENYIHQVGYTVIVIDRDPDSQIVEKVCNLPKCGFDRHYTSDNLNHDVFTLYY